MVNADAIVRRIRQVGLAPQPGLVDGIAAWERSTLLLGVGTGLQLVVFGMGAGALLALHFASWITSLEHTSVMVSVVLVTTNPIWVALFAPFLIGEKVNRQTLIGIAIAFVGGILVSFAEGDQTAAANPLLGSGLAIVGAVTVALYMIIGRRLRASLSLLPYIWLVYTTAAVILLITVLIVGTPLTGYAPESYFWMLMLALIPQLIGHSSFNYALAHISAAFVSLVTLAEPIGSALLAFIFLGEVPGWVQVIGAGLILSAVAIAQQSQPDLAENAESRGVHPGSVFFAQQSQSHCSPCGCPPGRRPRAARPRAGIRRRKTKCRRRP